VAQRGHAGSQRQRRAERPQVHDPWHRHSRTHYYTRLFTDAVCAVEAARSHPATAGLPLATTGVSQGGGLSIVAAHLAPSVRAAMPDVPFMAHPRRAVDVTNSYPYFELTEYCAVHSDRVETFLRHFQSLPSCGAFRWPTVSQGLGKVLMG